jgi:tetratricopeptide (TPR) repeat protein
VSSRSPVRGAFRHLLRSLVLACALGASTSASALPKNQEAARALEEGQVKYKAEDFAGAIEDFKRGYEIEADPAFLIAWAQAERQRGRCAAAVRLYKKFLATDPSEVAQEFAREGIVRCAEQLAADEVLPTEMRDEDDDEDDDDDDDGEVVPTPEVEEELEPRPEKTRERNVWIRDPLGTSLVAFGVVGTGVGSGLLIASAIQSQRLDRDQDEMNVNYGEFDDRVEGIRNLRIAGGVVVGVGAAVLIGGIVRWAVVGARAKKSRATVGFMLDRERAGLTISGRF